MDANKLDKLKDIGYTIRDTCGNCAYGRFPQVSEFGTCTQWTYTHLKHSGPDRQLSINVHGHCPAHERVAPIPHWGELRE